MARRVGKIETQLQKRSKILTIMDKRKKFYVEQDIDELIKDQVMPVSIQDAISVTPFKTYYNRRDVVEPLDRETFTLPSMTIPDQSMSVSELVYRYTHGMPLGGNRTPVYDEDLDVQFPANWDKLDISEKHDFFNEKAEELKDLRNKLQERQNQLTREQKEKELEEAVNKKLVAIRAMRSGQEPVQQEEP